MKYKIKFSGGSAGKITAGEELDKIDLCEGQTPRFGYYWWMWLPEFSINGGRVTEGEVVDINIHWLRWWCAVTLWPE